MSLGGDTTVDELTAWRERQATSILRASAVLGVVVLTLVCTTSDVRAMPLLVSAYVTVVLLLLVLAWAEGLPHTLRAGVMLVSLYAIGLSSMWIGGLESNGRLYLVALPAATTVLVGTRAGWGALFLALGTHAVVGVFLCDGMAGQLAGEISRDPAGWQRSLGSMLLISVAMMVPVSRLLKGQVYAAQFQTKNTELEIARDAAESAARAKSEFLATMSHELRTPMNGVLGMLQLLEDSELSDGQRDLIRTARASGGALLTVIGDILDFSKIEAEALEIVAAPLDLRGCIETALDVIAPTATAKGLEVGYWFEPGAPERIVGDAGRLRQILVNLLGNAVKFTDEGEVLVIVSGEVDGDGVARLALAVSDTGAGIPPEQVELVFDPFQQADGSITRKHNGTGLGLAICRSLAALMHGEISVESVLDAGSTFTLNLTAEVITEGGWEGPKLEGKRALVVSPSGTIARAMTAHLRDAGVSVTLAGGIEPALLRLSCGHFDVVLYDPRAPGDAFALLDLPKRPPLIGLRPLGDLSPQIVGVVQSLTTPLKGRLLLEVLARVMSGVAVASKVERPTLAQPYPLKILLVDDHPVNQQVGIRMLRAIGYEADMAVNGLQALEAVRTGDYDLVLMDCMMPVMDGLEATRKIRELVPEALQPRIVAMTANAQDEDAQACLAAGMDDVVTKPVERWALIEALLRTPQRKPGRDAA